MRFNDKKIIALIVAGGSGQRMKACGSFIPKQFIKVKDDLAIINYSYNMFVKHSSIYGVQLVFNSQDKIFYKKIIKQIKIKDKEKFLGIAEAGKTRQASVFSGLLAIEKHKPDYILIHDGARPLVSSELINNIIEKLNTGCKAVAPILPVTDTVGMLSDSSPREEQTYITSILKREQLALLQTPQGFSFPLLLECHHKEKEKSLSNTNNSNNINNYTDDIGLVQYYNYQVCHVPGELKNFKVTNTFDLQVLRMLKYHGFF